MHARMLDLLGLESRERNRDGELLVPLPEPLAPGEPPRRDADGNILYNPRWDESATADVNDRYMHAVADLILEQENVSCGSQL